MEVGTEVDVAVGVEGKLLVEGNFGGEEEVEGKVEVDVEEVLIEMEEEGEVEDGRGREAKEELRGEEEGE